MLLVWNTEISCLYYINKTGFYWCDSANQLAFKLLRTYSVHCTVRVFVLIHISTNKCCLMTYPWFSTFCTYFVCSISTHSVSLIPSTGNKMYWSMYNTSFHLLQTTLSSTLAKAKEPNSMQKIFPSKSQKFFRKEPNLAREPRSGQPCYRICVHTKSADVWD